MGLAHKHSFRERKIPVALRNAGCGNISCECAPCTAAQFHRAFILRQPDERNGDFLTKVHSPARLFAALLINREIHLA